MPPLYPFLLAGIFRLFGLYYSAASAAVILSLNSLLRRVDLRARLLYRRTRVRSAHRVVGRLALGPVSVFDLLFSRARMGLRPHRAAVLPAASGLALRLQEPAPPAALGRLRPALRPHLPVEPICHSCSFPVFLAIARGRLRARAPSAGPCRQPGGGARVYALGLAPWTARNYVTFHTLIPVRSGFWLEFEAGNHGETGNSNPPSVHPASSAEAMRPLPA